MPVTNATTSAPPVESRMPPGIPFIVGNEAAERFSFYGMRQILYIYLVSLFVGFALEQDVAPELAGEARVRATQVVHLFMAGVYLFPMIGAILADRLLGKFRVILWVSLIYCAGHAALALAGRFGAMRQLGLAEMVFFGGLILIAIGSGGIKPCVSANVGDQFTAASGHLVTRVFQIFYFTVNFGSFFATLLIPLIYQWAGPELAFGVPGILMAVATFVFWLGRRRFVRVPPRPGGALGLLDFFASALLTSPLLVLVGFGAPVAEEIVHAAMNDRAGAVNAALAHVAGTHWPHAVVAAGGFVLGLVLFAARQRIEQDRGFLAVLVYSWQHRKERQAGESFWAPAARRFGDEAADGPPAVLRVIGVFSMVSIFWALFDQHSSTWVEQAKAMNLVLVVPDFVFAWAAWGAVPGGALFGLVWLILWVSNVRWPRWATIAFVALLVATGAAAILLQVLRGQWIEIRLLAAQIGALNPLMVMIIIPLLALGVYRPLERRGRPLKPLTRMSIGMFLASISFAAVALLQARIEAVGPGQVHVLWQVIPFLLLTTAEVLVSVTGLEFAYTQAPRAMKSTIMGFWLLCVTLGNVLVAFLAPLQTLSLATFFWTFACLMAAAAMAFVFLSFSYKGKTYLQSEAPAA